MKFALDEEQTEFGRTLERMLDSHGTAPAVRAWAAGDPGPGRALWERLAATGVLALAVPEKYGGSGFLPVELAIAYEALGRHAAPGPIVESATAAVLLERLGDAETCARLLPALASGATLISYADREHGPYALDADAADTTLAVTGDELRQVTACGPVQPSVDPARRLSRPGTDGEILARGPQVREAAGYAADVARFLTAAQALGVGRRLLDDTVAHARQRTQFGVAVGSFQAVKHRLADTLLALEFARPLVFAAAVALAAGAPGAGGEVAAAKAAAGEAAYGAARTALQLHGAIGYTEELDLSLWIGKARALRTAWGTPGQCRARVLADLAGTRN